MSGLKTRDFVSRYYLKELAEKDTREIFYEKFCKINIIFLTNVSILRIRSLILKNASQKMYPLLFQVSPESKQEIDRFMKRSKKG